MAIDAVILELSKQLFELQKHNELLVSENQLLLTKIGKKNGEKRKHETLILPALKAWRKIHAEKTQKDLLAKYADRIAAIKKQDPRWNPPKEFFDI